MKKTFSIGCLFLTLAATAQEKYAPAVKQGTRLSYNLYVNGEVINTNFSFDSVANDYVKVGWAIEPLGTGSWIMKSKSLESATTGYWGQPTSGVAEELPDNQTVLMLSRAQWATIQKDQKVNFDGQTLSVKKPTEKQLVKLKDKIVDAILLENQNATTRIWVLNNKAFPILIKTEGGAAPDIALIALE
jgi:hypothetical protein